MDSGGKMTADNYASLREMIEGGKKEDAKLIIERLKSSNDPTIWHYDGVLKSMEGDYGDAKKSYLKCLELDENHSAALYNYANILVRQGKSAEAKEAFKKLKSIAPDSIIPRLDKAVVFIGLPHYGKIPMEFMLSYCDMVNHFKPSDNIDVLMTNCCGSRITSNRNQLVKMAQRKGATHILFIDTDMTWPVDALQRLLAHDKDIVCATTCKRGDEEGTPIGCAMGPRDGKTGAVLPDGLVEMKLVGSCFMLIKMDVFDKIGLPAYYEPPDPESGDAFGEDITFCKLALEKGYQIWLDYGLSSELGHIGEKIYQIKNKPTKEGGDVNNHPQNTVDK